MAPLFVGSNSDDSRIRSDRVGLAASTSNPASADTGDVYYNSTDNKLNVYDGSGWVEAGGGGTLSGIASGTIPNGATVIIHSDGKVGVITQTVLSAPTLGSAVVFESDTVYRPSATFDSSNNKVVIAYRDQGNSNYGTAIVGTVSGSSISFGSPVVFLSSHTQSISATFDSTNNKVVISYRNEGNSSYGQSIVGTVSGTSISFGSLETFETDSTSYVSSAFDSSNGKVVVAYRDQGNSNYGTAVVLSTNTLVTNLTSSNFLGFSDADYSDGATATIQIAGAVDDAQSGLTTGSLHYVQNDGTLSTTAGNPSVEAGTALSATKIKVKK